MKKQRITRLWSFLLTVLIIAGLLFSGPAQALTLGIINLDQNSIAEGQSISFQALVDLHDMDLLRDDVAFTITISSADTNHSCRFSLDSTILSGCTNFEVSINHSTLGPVSLGYGFIHGYGYGVLADYNFSNTQTTTYRFTPSYGYDSYTTDLSTDGEIIYDITWTADNIDANTNYAIGLNADITDGNLAITFESQDANEQSFTVTNQDDDEPPRRSGGGGGGNTFTPINTLAPELTTTPRLLSAELKHLKEIGELITITEHTTMKPDWIQEFSFSATAGSVAGTRHSLTLKDIHHTIDERYVIVELASDPQLIRVDDNSSVIVDTDQNGINDLIITAEITSSEEAQISLYQLSERAGTLQAEGADLNSIEARIDEMDIPEENIIRPNPQHDNTSDEEPPVEDATTNTTHTGVPFYVWILLGLLVAVGVSILILYYRHSKRYEY